MAQRERANTYSQSPPRRTRSSPAKQETPNPYVDERRTARRREEATGPKPAGHKKAMEEKSRKREAAETERVAKKQRKEAAKSGNSEFATNETEYIEADVDATTDDATDGNYTLRLDDSDGSFEQATRLNEDGRSAVLYYNQLSELLQQIRADAHEGEEQRRIFRVVDMLDDAQEKLRGVISANGRIGRKQTPPKAEASGQSKAADEDRASEAGGAKRTKRSLPASDHPGPQQSSKKRKSE